MFHGFEPMRWEAVKKTGYIGQNVVAVSTSLYINEPPQDEPKPAEQL